MSILIVKHRDNVKCAINLDKVKNLSYGSNIHDAGDFQIFSGHIQFNYIDGNNPTIVQYDAVGQETLKQVETRFTKDLDSVIDSIASGGNEVINILPPEPNAEEVSNAEPETLDEDTEEEGV